MPANYHLTFSFSENCHEEIVEEYLKRGGNVAVVYGDELPAEDFGAEVINGDENDLRFLDGRGKVVGLLYKTSIVKKDETGFVLTNRVAKSYKGGCMKALALIAALICAWIIYIVTPNKD